jgi:ribosome maturation factor RimP
VGQEIDVTLKLPFQGRKKYRGVLQALDQAQTAEAAAAEAAWRVVFSDGKVDQALDFSLQEVREARLVPVVDFKGRRFAPNPVDELVQAQTEDQVDGGDKK